MKKLLFSLFAVAMVFQPGCAMIKKLTCNEGVAKRNAEDDVKNGRTDQPGVRSGESCDGEYGRSQFETDYRRAYSEAVKATCVGTNGSKAGSADGEAGATDKPQFKQFKACEKMPSYKSIEANYNREYSTAFCSEKRAVRLAQDVAGKMEASNFNDTFASCEAGRRSLQSAYDSAYKAKYAEAVKARTDEFVRNTGTSSFLFQNRPYTASCRIVPDKSQLQVTVGNPHQAQALLQGQWKYTYYDKSFQRLMDDTTQEAVLLSNGNPKTFSKMTLPRDAEFCRAEFATVQ